MDYVRKGPTPLAIRSNRDEVYAMQDVLVWVSRSRGRDNLDPQDANEARDLYQAWITERNNGDVVLFERKPDRTLQYTVFHL